MERMVEPERMVAFRVAWVDDKGKQQVRTLLFHSSQWQCPTESLPAMVNSAVSDPGGLPQAGGSGTSSTNYRRRN